MVMDFPYKTGFASVALDMEGYYVWDSAVIKANGKYHMFCSRWKQELGFGCNWVFNSEIVHCVSEKPEGPYIFSNVVLPRRGRQYFDGMNTHKRDLFFAWQALPEWVKHLLPNPLRKRWAENL